MNQRDVRVRRLSKVCHAVTWNEIVYQGEVAAREFLAFYIKEDRVLAIAGMNGDREMAAAEELMRLGRMPMAAQLKANAVDLVQALYNTSRS